MFIANVQIDSVDKIQKFVNLVSSLDCDLELVSGRYAVNAKSIMGILGIDFSNQMGLYLRVGTESPQYVKEVLGDFIVKE